MTLSGVYMIVSIPILLLVLSRTLVFIVQPHHLWGAELRAKKLFMKYLSLRQRFTWYFFGQLFVIGNVTKTPYNISSLRLTYNIKNMKDCSLYCIVNKSPYIPFYDQYLGQLLMIRYAEQEFLKISNKKV